MTHNSSSVRLQWRHFTEIEILDIQRKGKMKSHKKKKETEKKKEQFARTILEKQEVTRSC
jgi:hypothetical protein